MVKMIVINIKMKNKLKIYMNIISSYIKANIMIFGHQQGYCIKCSSTKSCFKQNCRLSSGDVIFDRYCCNCGNEQQRNFTKK
jgi:hypothetical protein